MSYIYKMIPENINVQELLHQQPIKGIANKQAIDKLNFIVGSIYDPFIRNKDLQNTTSYAPLSSKIMKKYVADYSNCITYLVEQKIIEKRRSYRVDHYCQGYKFTSDYQNTPFKWVEITSWPICKQLKRYYQEQVDYKKLPYLNKWFNKNLQIDVEAAKKYNEHMYFLEASKKPSVKKLSAEQKANLRRMKIDYIVRYPENCGSRKNKTLRYYSYLTNLESGLRNFLTYDGQRLVAIDIKNAQPYFSTVLFNAEFWKKKKKSSAKSPIYLEGMIRYNEKIKEIRKRKKEAITIMCPVPSESLENSDIQLYQKMCGSGFLYESLLEKMLETINSGNKEKLTRDRIKKYFLAFLFAKENESKKWFREFHICFKTMYPSAYEMFTFIKSKNHALLAILLQSIESYLVLEVICSKFAKLYPNAPIYTIHDSIVTTQPYVGKLKAIMNSELTLAIGIEPTLKVEAWHPKYAYQKRN